MDFEMQLPLVAAASEHWRRSLDPASLREALRKLFLLRSEATARSNFLTNIQAELVAPVSKAVDRQLSNSENMRSVFDDRGNRSMLIAAEVALIVDRLGTWLENELENWMAAIHYPVDESVWIGERFTQGGVIDLLLLADAVGLTSFAWNVQPGDPPFRRLDMVARADIGMLTVSELYAQSIPVEA